MAKKTGSSGRVYAPTHEKREEAGGNKRSQPGDAASKKPSKAPKNKAGGYTGVHRLAGVEEEMLRREALKQLGMQSAGARTKLKPPEPAEPVLGEREESRDKPTKAGRGGKKKKPQKKQDPLDVKRLLTLLIVGVAVGGLLLAGWFVFLLEDVEIAGETQYSTGSIVSLTQLHEGRHMLLCDLAAAKEGIQTNPYLRVLAVTRIWPRTIRIEIEERKEIAVARTAEYDVVIDITGHVLSIGSGGDVSKLVQLIGVSQGGFQVNKPLGDNADFATRTLLNILDKLEEYGLLEDIALADVSNPLRTILMTRDGIQVVLGQPNELDEKFQWVKDTLPSLRLSGVAGGTLNVSAKGGAIYSPEEEMPAEPEEPQEPGNLEEPGNPNVPQEPGSSEEPGHTNVPQEPEEPQEPTE